MAGRNDISVIITRAEVRGVAFRVRDGQVEAQGLERLPWELVEELQAHRSDLLDHLSAKEQLGKTPETAQLLAWASELAEQDAVLAAPVSYPEAPLRRVTTVRASYYAAHYLRTISFARFQQQTVGGAVCTPEWWREREEEAFGALAALREALPRAGGQRSNE